MSQIAHRKLLPEFCNGYSTLIVTSGGGVIVKCPICESDSIESLGDNQSFCLDCDWDNLPELSEFYMSTLCLPFLGGTTIAVPRALDTSHSQMEHAEIDGVPYGSPIRIEGTGGARPYTIRFAALTVSIEE